MSVREFSPLFSWGFGFRRSKFLVPLLSNNVFAPGAEAVGVAGMPHSKEELQEFMLPATKPATEMPKSSLEDIARDFKVDHAAREMEGPRLVEVSEAPPVALDLKGFTPVVVEPVPAGPRSVEECMKLPLATLTNEEIVNLVDANKVQQHSLEKALGGDCARAVEIRRNIISRKLPSPTALEGLPQDHYDYKRVLGQCCENVVGYVGVPVGVAGPLLVDGREFMVPMATTEGCLVASTHRGCKAITLSGGVHCEVVDNGMTRGPVVRFPNVRRAAALQRWLETPENLMAVKDAFNKTSSFARLTSIKIRVAGRSAFLRFKASTGDAMGMNMISKGTTACLDLIQREFKDCELLSVSGNYCTDKKPAAINWIDGRGKSVTCDATLKKEVVESVLKTTVDALVDVNINKNLVGSAMAGAVGGFNAHAANLVAAVFLATGQDPAQVVESANCITLMEKTVEGDLYVSITMPSIECGTIGGGTILGAQSACLEMLGCKGASKTAPGSNAEQLARVICSTVMAGELSLMSALAAGHLVKSHMEHNRSKAPQ